MVQARRSSPLTKVRAPWTPEVSGENQYTGYPVINGLKPLVRAEIMGITAIVGYTSFLPLQTRPDIATFLLIACGLLAIYSQESLRPRLARLDLLTILLVIVATGMATLLSVDPARSLRYLVFLCLNIFLLLLATAMGSRRSVQIIAGWLGLFGALHLIALLVAGQFTVQGTASSIIKQLELTSLIVPNDALILGLCLPSLAFYILGGDVRKPLIPIIVLTLYVAFSVYVSYLLQSKLTLLSLAVALLVMVVVWLRFPRGYKLEKHRITLTLTTLGLLLLLGTSAWYLGNQSTTRLSLWSEATSAHATISEVLFGAGPNTFLYNPINSESTFDKGDLVSPWVHNLYLEAYYDQGIFGLTGILALTIIPLVRATKIEDQSVRAMLLASMVTFCFLALFEITLTRRFYFAFLAVMYGLSKAHRKEAEP